MCVLNCVLNMIKIVLLQKEIVEKKANLSLNLIEKDLGVLTEKKYSGLRVLQGWVENLS